MPRIIRLWVLGTLGALLVGCDDEPTGTDLRPDDRPREPSSAVNAHATGTPRIALEVRATGAFRPGAPIVITSTARAKQGAASVAYHLVVLDDDGNAVQTERGSSRAVGAFRGSMGRGGQQQLTATVTFAQAGYYRVVAIATTEPNPNDPAVLGDSTLINVSSETLYILIDEQGGRLTDGFDAGAIAGRARRYGSFGPFIAARAKGASGPAPTAMQVGAARAVGGRHVLLYTNEDDRNPDGSFNSNPVANAEIIVQCLDVAYQPISSPFSVRSAADGSFTISCASGYYNAEAHLRGASANVVNFGGSNAGMDYFNEEWDTYLYVQNSRAAHVYRNLNRYVPMAQQRFGLSRGQIITAVVGSDAAHTPPTTYYESAADDIHLKYDATFGEYGRFATVHEYGHAYHWVGVEQYSAPQPQYYCGGGAHTVPGQSDHNCAFVEGFADFFAYWLAGDALVSEPTYSDYAVENQIWYQGKDGSKVEGAFAGFLYDLVDGPSDLDSSDNRASTDDTRFVDGVTYPGSFIVNTMINCKLATSSYTYTKLYASFDLVYCLENSLEPYSVVQSFGFTWGSFTWVDRGNHILPTGFDQYAVRRLWRANLYGR
jgi:hypothetical protein